ncbi:MAG: WecB/TagA/CpsF family glycosyltransferase, partial [Paracraurococcus sp.]
MPRSDDARPAAASLAQRPGRGAGIQRGTVLGLPVDAAPSLETVSHWLAGQLAAAPGAARARLVTFVNPAAVACAGRNPDFQALLQRFDLVLPDGIGMALAIRALLGRQATRISFDSTSLALPVFGQAAEQGRSIAFVGGRPGVAARAQEAIRQRFPALRCIGAWSGHGDMTATIRDLVAAAPDLVVCGMGSVAQEAFLQ